MTATDSDAVWLGYAYDPARTTMVLDHDDLAHLIEQIGTADEVVMDLETTGLEESETLGGKRSNGGVGARIVLAAFTIPSGHGESGTWILPLSHPDSPFQGEWVEVMRRVAQTMVDDGIPLINQNVKFDARWVYACVGVDLSPLIAWDTRVSSHLLDENSSASLKERAPATFNIERWDDFSLKEPGAAEHVPLFQLGEYGARDTYWTWALSDLHRRSMALGMDGEAAPDPDTMTPDEIEDYRLGRLAVWCAMPTVATLTAVEQRGILLDQDWVREHLAEEEDEAARIQHVLASRYEDKHFDGEPSFAPTATWFRAWADEAIARGDLRVAEMTPTGRPKWSRAVLVRQARAGSTVAGLLLAMRSHAKKCEYLRAWLGFVGPDGRIRTTYSAGTVVTGRLSSQSPNLQQVTASLKPAFIPSPGHLLAELDYSQIELRAAAFIARCEPMLEAFRRGDDLHNLLAARITGKPSPEVTKPERQAGKSANFGLLYGMSAEGFRLYAEDVYGISFSQEGAHAVHRTFFDTWQGMAEWHARTAARVERIGAVSSPIGRMRRLPEAGWSEAALSRAKRAAINAPVQGFASDIMQIAAASIEGRLPGHPPVRGARIVATVHDSIVVEVPEDRASEVVALCEERMRTVPEVLRRMDCDFNVPLEIDSTVGTRWGNEG